MKRYRRWIALLIFIFICAGGVWLTLQITAEYPALGEPVSYPVNEVEGFELTVENPSWSPFKGYTIRWAVTANSKETYTFFADGTGFEFLECCIDGQWYRLDNSQDAVPYNSLEFPMGGEDSGTLQGSIVQKYDDYGTRLDAGTYRVVLEMRAKDGTPHYLAAEFGVE